VPAALDRGLGLGLRVARGRKGAGGWLPGMGLLLALALLLGAPAPATGLQVEELSPLEVRIWLDREENPVLRRGDRVRLYYRTSEPAWVAIFHVDTNGSIRLLFPRSPGDDHRVAPGRDFRLLFPRSSYWTVDEHEGKGYFFAVASPRPFDFGALPYRPSERTWDLSTVGRSVYGDPYLAMDDYVAALVPDWEVVPYGLDFLSYDVEQRHDYPRFLCYDCHGFQSYASWNPYTYACSTFRLVIWDDPYFYPTYRYGPTRVVFASNRGRARFEFQDRAPGEAWSPVRRTRQPAQRRAVRYLEPSVAEPDRPSIARPSRRAQPRSVAPDPTPSDTRSATPPRRGAATAAPSSRPAAERSARPSPSTAGEDAGRRLLPGAGTRAGEATRPTLQRRPAESRREASPSGQSPSAGSGEETRRPTRVLIPGRRPSTGSGAGAEPGAQATPRERGARVVRPPGSARPSPRPSPSTGASPGSRPSARPTPSAGRRPTVRVVPSRPSARPSRPPARPRPKPKPPGG